MADLSTKISSPGVELYSDAHHPGWRPVFLSQQSRWPLNVPQSMYSLIFKPETSLVLLVVEQRRLSEPQWKVCWQVFKHQQSASHRPVVHKLGLKQGRNVLMMKNLKHTEKYKG